MNMLMRRIYYNILETKKKKIKIWELIEANFSGRLCSRSRARVNFSIDALASISPSIQLSRCFEYVLLTFYEQYSQWCV